MADRKKKRQRADARKRAEKREQERSGVSYLKIPQGVELWEPDGEGPFILDFFAYIAGEGNPYAEEGQEHFERTFFIHKNVGPNNKWVICPNKTTGGKKPCPICEDISSLRADTPDSDKEGQEAIKQILPKERQIWLHKVRSDEAKKDVLRIWEVSFYLFGAKLEGELADSDEEEGNQYFPCAQGGKTLRVGFNTKTFGKATYYEARSIKFRSREDFDDEIIDKMPCLDDLLVIQSYDDIKSIYHQEPDEGDKDKSSGSNDGWGDDSPKEEQPKQEQKEDEGWGDDEPQEKNNTKQDASKSEQTTPPEETPEKSESSSDDENSGGGEDWDSDWD